ncbi:hypothetical protein [Carbonactinospora thermoautotrophica]|uniref:hypothetical protein n=1 Tax=Carbonactinospora thermoautotrophica TaxID=1469144 RepID=UPI002EDAE9EB
MFSLSGYLITNLFPGGVITPGWLALALVEDPNRVLLPHARHVGTPATQKHVIR